MAIYFQLCSNVAPATHRGPNENNLRKLNYYFGDEILCELLAEKCPIGK